ncbi:phosphate ABC transporter permease PstA [Brevundimonas sp.]|uniref:phosphate ABC transporter permease PstA n=1 Tax=Brevundimonas sp. TaxID=1871086 RepID=UPI0025F829F9|nr:phosphate ABC transporter permease PstA [Brevundimonas sp.]
MTNRADIRAAVEARLKRRHAAERRFRLYGVLAIAIAIGFLAILLGRVIQQGHTAFWTHSVSLPVLVDPARVDPAYPAGANFDRMIAEQLAERLGAGSDPEDVDQVRGLLSPDMGFQLSARLRDDPSLVGQTISIDAPVSDDADLYLKGEIERATAEDERTLSDRQLDWLESMREEGLIEAQFNSGFFTRSDSTQPETAGLLGAVVGSALMLLVTAVLAIPLGVGAAVWLEEFAPKNRWTEIIEVNINNLAAVPSIVYGLLGLAVFIGWMGLPRSSPLVGGIVLALMALPTVIIATRASLKAVPPSIRDAALALGASRTQTVFSHVLPLALPGVMTGAIISLAHALGETAPLLMIGMVSFVPGVPEGIMSASSALPTQIFIWENASEYAFHERTAAAIIVLLLFMIVMNAVAIVLRSRLERRW